MLQPIIQLRWERKFNFSKSINEYNLKTSVLSMLMDVVCPKIDNARYVHINILKITLRLFNLHEFTQYETQNFQNVK